MLSHGECLITERIWTQSELLLVSFSPPSQYTEDVSLKIEHINVNLSNIVLLDEIGKQNLLNFSSSGIDGINFAAYLTEVR